MSSLRVRWGCNDVSRYIFSSLNSKRCHPLSKHGLVVNVKSRGRSRMPRPLCSVANGGGGVVVHSELNSSMLFDDVRNSKGVGKKVVDKEEIVSGKVDQWIRESVEEIVSNIEEAPFLVQIYSDNNKEEGSSSSSTTSTSTSTRVVREKASSENWPFIKRKWEGENSIPNGIALVEELKSHNNNINQTCSSSSSSTTKVWGIVIQERGTSCPACYILKTSRVRSVSGICTHFCLFRTECFAEYADVQLKKLWLL